MLYSNEHELSQGRGQTSERQLLVGVDTPITPATRYMLRTIGTFFDPYMMHMHLVVLTVIPTPYPAGRSVAPYPLSLTREQWMQAEETLLEVQSALQHDGLSSSQIEMLVRMGSPADELAAVASRRHIDCIVIGSRGNSPGQRFRRWLTDVGHFWNLEAPDLFTMTLRAWIQNESLPPNLEQFGVTGWY
jgi:nucleotide-binding universal stress UspA family protein